MDYKNQNKPVLAIKLAIWPKTANQRQDFVQM